MTRPENAQQANDRIVEKAVRLRFASRLPLHCECSDPNCDAVVLIELDAYRSSAEDGAFLTAPGHSVAGAKVHREEEGYWVYRRALV